MANNTFGRPSDAISDAVPSIHDVASRVQDGASALKEKASAFGHDAVDAIDARLPGKVSQFAHQTADKLSATADYVRDNTMQGALADLEAYVKAHPTQALLGAAVVGFCAGRMLSRD